MHASMGNCGFKSHRQEVAIGRKVGLESGFPEAFTAAQIYSGNIYQLFFPKDFARTKYQPKTPKIISNVARTTETVGER